jgi:hypothetical protein
VVILGNHDNIAPKLGRDTIAELLSNATYLENEEAVDVAGGLRLFATPLSHGHSGNDAYQSDAFAAATEAAVLPLKPHVDVLISHGPSQQGKIANETPGELEPWARKLQPRLHLWGHAHALHGVRFSDNLVSVCASIMDVGYCPEQLAVVVDLALNTLTIS